MSASIYRERETVRLAAFHRWLATRPEAVRKLAAEFPLHTPILIGGRTSFIIGWNENDMLIVSQLRLDQDYELALASARYVCATPFRKGGV